MYRKSQRNKLIVEDTQNLHKTFTKSNRQKRGAKKDVTYTKHSASDSWK